MTTSSAATPTVHLPAHLADEIIAHAREGKPEEICGIVRGQGLLALEAVRGRNIAEERIENYEVDPQTLLRQFDFEDAGDEMMGIYHSHPVSEAYPSATDAWNAHYPDSIYFICSLEDDEAPIIRAFRMTTHFLGAESQGLVGDISFYETRPGLFAYYQAADKPLPPSLASKIDGVSPPFYIVYFTLPDSTQDREMRAVTILEYPIVSN